MPNSEASLGRMACLGGALFSLLTSTIGSVIVLYVYAFASMVDPQLSPGDRWCAILEKMFLSGAIVPTVLGLSLASLGAAAALWCSAGVAGLATVRFSCSTIRLAAWGGLALLAVTAITIALS